MHPDDDFQTTLSKWPFILGDVLLVGMALAIAILGDWQLTNWQVAACVAAVALGAALFVLPYVVEFQVRVREEHEDRAGDLRILKKHILAAEETLAEADARFRAVENATAEADQHNAAMAEVADQKFVRLESARVAQEKSIQALEKKLQELPKASPATFDPEMLKPLEVRLDALEARPMPLSQTTAAVSTQESSKASAPPPEPKAAEPAAEIERPKRTARERHGPEESRLLRRAISAKGDHSSSAVSRIIESKVQKPEPLPEQEEPEPAQTASTAVEEETSEDGIEPAPQPSAPVEEPDSAEEPMPAGPTAAAPASENRQEHLNTEPAAEVDAPEIMDTLLEEAETSSPLPRTKVRKKDTVLTASVLIGIGNKPYLRGSSGGLNWEEGVMMEFKEIGKWQWIAPADLDAPLELQIFRNDEDPDTSGRYTLEPGQKLEITPVF